MKFPPDDPTEVRLAEIRAFIDSLNFFERNEVRDHLARKEEFSFPLSARGDELLDAILQLDWEEQMALSEKLQLIHGRPPGIMSEDDPRHEADLERRLRECEAGEAKWIDSEEFFRQLREERQQKPTN
jgi:hypothetical protein